MARAVKANIGDYVLFHFNKKVMGGTVIRVTKQRLSAEKDGVTREFLASDIVMVKPAAKAAPSAPPVKAKAEPVKSIAKATPVQTATPIPALPSSKIKIEPVPLAREAHPVVPIESQMPPVKPAVQAHKRVPVMAGIDELETAQAHLSSARGPCKHSEVPSVFRQTFNFSAYLPAGYKP